MAFDLDVSHHCMPYYIPISLICSFVWFWPVFSRFRSDSFSERSAIECACHDGWSIFVVFFCAFRSSIGPITFMSIFYWTALPIASVAWISPSHARFGGSIRDFDQPISCIITHRRSCLCCRSYRVTSKAGQLNDHCPTDQSRVSRASTQNHRSIPLWTRPFRHFWSVIHLDSFPLSLPLI